jgi:hypothetical protein
MATYIQNVSDYIPQFQPFTPDLNIYNTTMQTLQSKYDSGYKALNKVYGQFLYADLSREDNQATKEDLLKQIDFNLKRVSGLDLSLEQNVNQAVQVFKPFYENKEIMKDMAYTKNYMAQKSRAEGLKNSFDTERRKEYWDDGAKALDYQREEFIKASKEEALTFDNPTYTPYVNVMDKALKIAKDSELSIESVKFSPDGRYIIKTKNGEQLTEPLQRLFEAQLGDDPAIRDVYKTKAYVNRKDYAYSNASLFGGDVEKAEMKYLEDQYTVLKQQSQRAYSALEDENKTYDSKIKYLEDKIANKQGGPQAKQELEQLKYNKQINDKVLDRVKKDNETLSDNNFTSSTQSGFQNPYGDIKTLRYKVDQGITNNLLQKDLSEAAQLYAFRNSSVDIKADEYAVLKQKHAYDMSAIAVKHRNDLALQRVKNKDDNKLAYMKDLHSKGLAYYDKETGELKEIPDNVGVRSTEDGAVGNVNMKNLSRETSERFSEDFKQNYMNSMLVNLREAKAQGLLTDAQIKDILQIKGQGYSIEAFSERLGGQTNKFLRGTLGQKGLAEIHKKYKDLASNNKAFSEITGDVNFNNASIQFDQYTQVIESDQKWRESTSKEVAKELRAKGFYHAHLAYDDGNLVSEDVYIKRLAQEGKLTNEQQKLIQVKRRLEQQIVANKRMVKKGTTSLAKDALNKKEDYLNTSWIEGLKMLNVSAAYGTNNLSIEQAISAIDDKLDKSINYDELKQAASKLYSDSNFFAQRNIKAPIGIEQAMSGTGLYSGESFITANPGAPGRKGTTFASQALNMLNSSDLGDANKYLFSFEGKGVGALKNAKENALENKSIGKALINELMREFNNTKSKAGNIEYATQQLVGGDPSKSAIIFRPSIEWLRERTGTDKKGNLLNEEQFAQISKNGLTIFVDKEQGRNFPMLSQSGLNPIESIVSQQGSYNMDNPYGPGFMKFEQDKLMGGYNVRAAFSDYDPTTGKIISVPTKPMWVPDLNEAEQVLRNFNSTSYERSLQLSEL